MPSTGYEPTNNNIPRFSTGKGFGGAKITPAPRIGEEVVITALTAVPGLVVNGPTANKATTNLLPILVLLRTRE